MLPILLARVYSRDLHLRVLSKGFGRCCWDWVDRDRQDFECSAFGSRNGEVAGWMIQGRDDSDCCNSQLGNGNQMSKDRWSVEIGKVCGKEEGEGG